MLIHLKNYVLDLNRGGRRLGGGRWLSATIQETSSGISPDYRHSDSRAFLSVDELWISVKRT